MADDAAPSSGLSEANAAISAVGSEYLDAVAAADTTSDGQDDAAALSSEQQAEITAGGDALQQAADEEAILDEPSAVAEAHLAGRPTQPRIAHGQRVEGEADDEDADIQPGALEGGGGDSEVPGVSQATAASGADAEGTGAGGAVAAEDEDEDFELTAEARAAIEAELAGLQDGAGADDDGDGDLRYRPHSILDDDDDDEEVPEGERIRKKKKTTHERSGAADSQAAFAGDAAGEEDGVAMTDKERRKYELNKRIDQALKSGKKKRQRKQDNVDDLDKISDQSVDELKAEMIEAANRDEEANMNKGLVIEKLKLLPKVLATLQKTHLQQAITDNNLLDGVRRWLEPLPDHSLPALNIQRSFFAVLEKMPIDSISLKMSGLGKIMMFYSMNTKVDPAIRRSADRLIEIWSRPIIKKSSSFRDRSLTKADFEPSGVQYMGSQSALGSQPGAGGAEVPLSAGAAARVRVPQAVVGYSVVPRSAVGAGGPGEGASQSRIKNAAKLRTFKSKLKDSKQR